VEWRSVDLEREACQQKHDTQRNNWFDSFCLGKALRNLGERARAERPVDEAHAVEQDGGRDKDQQQVLERRLAGSRIVLRVAHKHDQRQARQLQTEEDREELGGRREQHATEDRPDDQRVELSGPRRELGHGVDRHEQHKHADADEEQLEEGRQRIDLDDSAE
jgi:hypothetical protein